MNRKLPGSSSYGSEHAHAHADGPLQRQAPPPTVSIAHYDDDDDDDDDVGATEEFPSFANGRAVPAEDQNKKKDVVDAGLKSLDHCTLASCFCCWK